MVATASFIGIASTGAVLTTKHTHIHIHIHHFINRCYHFVSGRATRVMCVWQMCVASDLQRPSASWCSPCCCLSRPPPRYGGRQKQIVSTRSAFVRLLKEQTKKINIAVSHPVNRISAKLGL